MFLLARAHEVSSHPRLLLVHAHSRCFGFEFSRRGCRSFSEVCRMRLKPLSHFINDVICIVKSATSERIFNFCCCCLVINSGHVLQLLSETVAVCKQMIYDGHIITRDELAHISWHLSYGWGKTPEKTSTRKLTRPGIKPRPATWKVTMYL